MVEGIQHSYFLKDGKAHTTAFTYAPSFYGVVDSFMAQRPAKVSLECLTDSVLLRIPYYELQVLVKKHRGIETFFSQRNRRSFGGFNGTTLRITCLGY